MCSVYITKYKEPWNPADKNNCKHIMSATHYSFHPTLLDPPNPPLNQLNFLWAQKWFSVARAEQMTSSRRTKGVRSDIFLLLVYWTSFCWHVIQKKLFKRKYRGTNEGGEGGTLHWGLCQAEKAKKINKQGSKQAGERTGAGNGRLMVCQ